MIMMLKCTYVYTCTCMCLSACQVLLPRLEQCEQRLAGVSNLAGSLMAVDLMAAELGVAVPHYPLPASVGGSAAAPPPMLGLPQTVGGPGAPQQQQQQQPVGLLTISRQQQLQQQIEAGKEQMAAVQHHLHQLQQQVRGVVKGEHNLVSGLWAAKSPLHFMMMMMMVKLMVKLMH